MWTVRQDYLSYRIYLFTSIFSHAPKKNLIDFFIISFSFASLLDKRRRQTGEPNHLSEF